MSIQPSVVTKAFAGAIRLFRRLLRRWTSPGRGPFFAGV